MWVCPECERRFGRTNQGHECAPGLSIEEYFETGPAFERPIFDAIAPYLRAECGDELWIEPVSVGIFFKRRTTFAQLRTKTKWVAVGFSLPHRLDHSRISRKPVEHAGRWFHVVNVRSAEEVDTVLLEWLVDAFDTDGAAGAG